MGSNMPGIFNLVDQLSFYGTYHTNKWNTLIHIIFVPVIVWTVLVWFAYTESLFSLQLPAPVADYLGPVVYNGAFVIASIYSVYYIFLERNIAGLMAAAILMFGWMTATSFYEQDPQTAWKTCL